MKRCDIEDKYKWDLTCLYNDFSSFESELEKIDLIIEEIKTYKGNLLSSSESLYTYFKLDEKAASILEKLHFYAFLVIDEDINNAEAQKYLNMVEDAIAKYNSAISFFNSELLKSDYELVENYIKNDDRLKEYERVLKKIYRQKEHLLTEAEEIIINEMDNIAQSFDRSSRLIRNTELDLGKIKDEDGNEVTLMPSNIIKYARSVDRNVRKSSYDNEISAYKGRINSIAANYIGFIKTYETEAKLRKFNSFLEQKLFGSEIDIDVYNTLKSVVKDNIKIYQKYLKLVKDILKVDTLEAYDLSAPLVEKSNKNYTIEEAKEIILKTFACYGEEYVSILKYAFESRSIDFLPCEDKITGWYSAYIPFAKPKIFANYNSKITDVSSLVHELGHFVNQYRIIENQPPQYVYQTSFCAEVSSLTNEIVFSYKMLELETDENVKKELLINFIKMFAANMFGASRQALFEEEAHTLVATGKASSSEELNNIWYNINKEFNGKIVNSSSSVGWAAIPHYYLNRGYYVFNYSTGVIAACNLASKLLNNEPGIHEKFMKYLTLGCSLPPIEALKTLGIDMTSSNTFENAIKMFSDAIDEFYKISNM